ncbi:MAG: NYN domain-containing protein [Clostridia bacterium]|nr:NYN domain-containing protein [Clostridia bacterium]
MKTKRTEPPVNAAVFIDYENVYRALLKQRTNVLRCAFFEKLRKWCADRGRRLVRTVVYCNFDIRDLHESYHQSVLQNYGVETVHTSNQGKNYADMKLTIDVLTSMYSNDNIDEFFIMSNDKDMTPLLNTIRANKRAVALITTGDAYNPAVCEFADTHVTFDEICSEVVEDRVIDRIADNYWRGFKSYIASQLLQHEETGVFGHQGLTYVLKNQIRYHKVMQYELASILKDLYDADEIFFYYYTFKDNEFVGFAPTERRQELLDKELIREEDIIPDFDLAGEVEILYSEACGS